MTEKRVYLNPLSAASPLTRALAPFFPRYRSLLALEAYPEHLRGPLRNLVMSTDRRILFLRNLKCACTSVAQLLYYYSEGRFYPRSIHRATRGVYLARYWWSEIEPVYQAHSAFLFTLTRSPQARAWSGFTNFFVDASNIARHNHMGPMRDHGYDPAHGESYNFDVFLDYIEHSLAIDPLQTSAHFRPQVFNIAFGEIPYDHIGKVETLADDLRVIFERAGAPGFPPKELIEQRFNRSEAPRTPLTPAQRRRVRTIFARDYEAFGYDD
ncbi:sulfotransferase family 2 domain-containing protein [Rhodovulum steppense]|uniref:Sulfotransferase family protein n=1 Tax=Rhodovulum steppense TaxID=540251 RepID=A0A4R1YZ10_9RHOB|nr:sulfotransferase family 2 domain-containing protein [Rhodovulum steppense]TCM86532.1 sulfotransferase family protein [Rhodovulum steppense]